MNCKERTSLKLSSNIISEKSGRSCVGAYVPAELQPDEFKDERVIHCLTERQRKQVYKRLFETRRIKEDEERFPEKPENIEMCKGCEYRDICF